MQNDLNALVEILKNAVLAELNAQENGTSSNILLDNKDNTNPNLTSLCLRKNVSMRGEKRREYQDIFSSFSTKQRDIFSKPEGQ